MSRPIQETPILKGKDAVKFIKKMYNSKNKVTETERKRIITNFNKLSSIARF